MNQTDQSILRLLQENARISLSDMGKRIALSVPAVRERIRKLEQSGVIKRYTAVVDSDKLDKHICCYCLLALRAKGAESEEHFRRLIASEPDVQECHCISGEYEYLLKITTESTQSLEQILRRFRGHIPVLRTNTLMVLSSVKGDISYHI